MRLTQAMFTKNREKYVTNKNNAHLNKFVNKAQSKQDIIKKYTRRGKKND